MDLLHRLQFWGDRHHPKWMDIVRIALGIFLVYKAIDFLNNMSDLVTLMSQVHLFWILRLCTCRALCCVCPFTRWYLINLWCVNPFRLHYSNTCYAGSYFLCKYQWRNVKAVL